MAGYDIEDIEFHSENYALRRESLIQNKRLDYLIFYYRIIKSRHLFKHYLNICLKK